MECILAVGLRRQDMTRGGKYAAVIEGLFLGDLQRLKTSLEHPQGLLGRKVVKERPYLHTSHEALTALYYFL